MTNREWLMEQMQNMSDEELARDIILRCDAFELDNGEKCVHHCQKCRENWLKAEHKEKNKTIRCRKSNFREYRRKLEMDCQR